MNGDEIYVEHMLGTISRIERYAAVDRHPEVPWRRMAGMRDVLSHNYMGVDLTAVWEVAQDFLPDLRLQLQAILDGDFGN